MESHHFRIMKYERFGHLTRDKCAWPNYNSAVSNDDLIIGYWLIYVLTTAHINLGTTGNQTHKCTTFRPIPYSPRLIIFYDKCHKQNTHTYFFFAMTLMVKFALQEAAYSTCIVCTAGNLIWYTTLLNKSTSIFKYLNFHITWYMGYPWYLQKIGETIQKFFRTSGCYQIIFIFLKNLLL